MAYISRLLLAWAILLTTCSAIPTGSLVLDQRTTTPLPPSHDPWYTAPANYESTTPGTILRIRPAPGNLTSITINCSSSYNILYRTTNSLYNPSWAVTTLFIPLSSHTTPTTSTHSTYSPLLSYQIPYNSADVDASPSYSLYSSISAFTDIPASLGRHWYVSVPDFEGPLASFALGVSEGHATLDSVRAVLSSGLLASPASSARYAMWGYSGGSIASEFAAELQVQYAPELHFRGTAIGGMPANVTSALLSISSTMWD